MWPAFDGRAVEQIDKRHDHEYGPGVSYLALQVAALSCEGLHGFGEETIRTRISLTRLRRRARWAFLRCNSFESFSTGFHRKNSALLMFLIPTRRIGVIIMRTRIPGAAGLEHRYTRNEVERMIGVTRRELDYWT